MAADGGCERDVVHRMNEGYRVWGALKRRLRNRGQGIKAKKCLYTWNRERGADLWNQFVHSSTEAQRVYGVAMASYNERTRMTLTSTTCSHKWWETLKGSIFGEKPSIPTLTGPGGALVVSPLRKLLSWRSV